jgi:hypothetical protein
MTIPKRVFYEETFNCPFCCVPIDDKTELLTYDGINQFEGGLCDCGAIYVPDYSGVRLGEAYENALLYVCQGSRDKMMQMSEGEDYLVKILDPQKTLSRRSLAYARFGFGSVRGRKKYFFLKVIRQNDAQG